MLDDIKIKKIGKDAAQMITHLSFKIWQQGDFRKLINFDNISQTEQDRIFNELEVSFIGLFVLHLDSIKPQIQSEEDLDAISRLQTAITSGFLELYRELKIDQKNLNQWETLISMRIAEYRKDFGLLMEETKKMKEFSKDGDLKYLWARVETITLDMLSHIRRGKLEHKDPLRRQLQKVVTVLDQTFGQSIKKTVLGSVDTLDKN